MTLTVWRDAKTDPPQDRTYRMTNAGCLRFDARINLWCYYDQEKEMECYAPSQPSVWCDPSPPSGDDALTVEKLDSICGLAMIGVLELEGIHREDAEADIARLRRALDSIERNTD